MASSIFGPKAVQPKVLQQPSSIPGSNPDVFAGLQQIKELMQMINSGGNVGKMAEFALSKHPNYPKVIEMIQQYGGDARAAFYAEAKRRGKDPNEILNLLR